MSVLEDAIGIKYSDLTHEEREAIDRIKIAFSLLTPQERRGSATDIITDLSVAIVAEMRLAAEEAVDAAMARHDRDSKPDDYEV